MKSPGKLLLSKLFRNCAGAALAVSGALLAAALVALPRLFPGTGRK